MEGAFLEGSITRLRAEEQEEEDHRQKPRTSRRVFWHDDALECIKRDYLVITGNPRTPLLGKEFPLMFRVSRGRFQCMMEDIAASTAAPFYLNRVNASKEEGPSFEARLLLPLKCLAYGVPPPTHTLTTSKCLQLWLVPAVENLTMQLRCAIWKSTSESPLRATCSPF